MRSVTVHGNSPVVAGSAWIAADVVLVGDVHIGESCGVFYGSVLRADSDSISIGEGTNIQDGCVVHADPGLPVVVGSNVSVGHRAILHGCTVEDDVLIGMGATVLNGARIGSGSLIAAGTVVLEDTHVPANSLMAGVPGKVRRETSVQEREDIADNARQYRRLAVTNAEGAG
ncbi:MAG: gamma carbonic anhydrase family protein [Candidatus Nanopelagicales bacterium]